MSRNLNDFNIDFSHINKKQADNFVNPLDNNPDFEVPTSPIQPIDTGNDYTDNQINTYQNYIDSVNQPIPKVDDNSTKRSLLQKIFDTLSFGGNAIRGGIYNAVDNNPNTSVLQGIKEGLHASNPFQNDTQAKTTKDIGEVLKQSKDANTRDLGNVISNPVASFIGDVVTDPLSYVGGLGEGGKLLSKGSEGLNAEKAIGGVDKASEILKSIGQEAGTKNAESLVNKTAKTLGYMPDYKGLRLQLPLIGDFTGKGKVFLNPETIAKAGDTALGKVVSTPIKALETAKQFVKDSTVAPLFAGTKNWDLIQAARQNPDDAMKIVAQMDSLKTRWNNSISNIAKHFEFMKNAENQMENNSADTAGKVLGGLETTQKYAKDFNTNYIDTTTSDFIKKANDFKTNQIDKLNSKIDSISKEIDSMKVSGADANSILKRTTKLLDMQNNMTGINSLDLSANLKKLNFDIPKSLKDSFLTDPISVSAAKLDDLKKLFVNQGGLSEADALEQATILKNAAELTIQNVKQAYPSMSEHFNGIEKIKAKMNTDTGVGSIVNKAVNTADNLAQQEAAIGKSTSGDVQFLKQNDIDAMKRWGNPEEAKQYTKLADTTDGQKIISEFPELKDNYVKKYAESKTSTDLLNNKIGLKTEITRAAKEAGYGEDVIKSKLEKVFPTSEMNKLKVSRAEEEAALAEKQSKIPSKLKVDNTVTEVKGNSKVIDLSKYDRSPEQKRLIESKISAIKDYRKSLGMQPLSDEKLRTMTASDLNEHYKDLTVKANKRIRMEEQSLYSYDKTGKKLDTVDNYVNNVHKLLYPTKAVPEDIANSHNNLAKQIYSKLVEGKLNAKYAKNGESKLYGVAKYFDGKKLLNEMPEDVAKKYANQIKSVFKDYPTIANASEEELMSAVKRFEPANTALNSGFSKQKVFTLGNLKEYLGNFRDKPNIEQLISKQPIVTEYTNKISELQDKSSALMKKAEQYRKAGNEVAAKNMEQSAMQVEKQANDLMKKQKTIDEVYLNNKFNGKTLNDGKDISITGQDRSTWTGAENKTAIQKEAIDQSTATEKFAGKKTSVETNVEKIKGSEISKNTALEDMQKEIKDNYTKGSKKVPQEEIFNKNSDDVLRKYTLQKQIDLNTANFSRSEIDNMSHEELVKAAKQVTDMSNEAYKAVTTITDKQFNTMSKSLEAIKNSNPDVYKEVNKDFSKAITMSKYDELYSKISKVSGITDNQRTALNKTLGALKYKNPSKYNELSHYLNDNVMKSDYNSVFKSVQDAMDMSKVGSDLVHPNDMWNIKNKVNQLKGIDSNKAEFIDKFINDKIVNKQWFTVKQINEMSDKIDNMIKTGKVNASGFIRQFGNSEYTVSGKFNVFKTPNGVIKIDVNADPNKVNKILATYRQIPKNLTTSSSLNVFKDFPQELKGLNINQNGSKNVLTSENVDNIYRTLTHEVGHNTNNITKDTLIHNTMKGELNSLNDEDIKTISDSLNSIGIKTNENILKGGNISEYVSSISDTAKPLENKADLVVAALNNKTSAILKSKVPNTYKMVMDDIAKLPEKEIQNVIPKSIPLRNELIDTITKYKGYTSVAADKVKSIADLQNKITKINNMDEEMTKKYYLDHITNVLKNDKSYGENLSPELKSFEDEATHWNITSDYSNYSDMEKQFIEEFRKKFDVMQTKEGTEFRLNYVPHIKNPDAKDIPSDFIPDLQTTKGVLQQPVNKFARERNNNFTIEQINKWAKEKYGIDNYMDTSLTRIYLKRAIGHEKFMYDKKTLDDTLKLFGHQIVTKGDLPVYDAANKAKYFNDAAKLYTDKLKELGVNDVSNMTYKEIKKLYESKITERFNSGKYVFFKMNPEYEKTPIKLTSFNPAKAKMSNETIDSIMSGSSLTNPFIEVDAKDIKTGEYFKKADAPLISMPKYAYDSYMKVMNKQYKETSNVLVKAFDRFTQLFKANATSVNPSFHVNNFLGNNFQNWLDIGSKMFSPTTNKDALKIMKVYMGHGNPDEVLSTGHRISDILDVVKKYDVVGNDIFNEGQKELMSNKIDKLSSLKKNPISALNPFNTTDAVYYKAGRNVGSYIEGQARLVNFLTHIREGKTYQEAADLTNKYLFDYSDLSSFEQNVMKRVVPFYTWMRKNIPLQIESMINKPDKYIAANALTKAIQQPETSDQADYKPDYLKDAIHIGNGKYINPNLPYKDLSKLGSPKDLFSSLNPAIKMLVELGTNKNVYYGSAIKKNQFDETQAPLYAEPFAKNTSKGKMVDPIIPYLVQNITPSVPNISNALSILLGKKGDSQKAQNWVTGFKVYQPDTQTQKSFAKSDYLQKLKDYESMLRKEGYDTRAKSEAESQAKKEAQSKKYNDIIQKNKEIQQYYKDKAEYYKNKRKPGWIQANQNSNTFLKYVNSLNQQKK